MPINLVLFIYNKTCLSLVTNTRVEHVFDPLYLYESIFQKMMEIIFIFVCTIQKRFDS